MIRTHPDFFVSEQHDDSEKEQYWWIGKAVGVLVVSSVLAAWMSENLVGAVAGASEFMLNCFTNLTLGP
jgi:Ca2+/H+ antiporter